MTQACGEVSSGPEWTLGDFVFSIEGLGGVSETSAVSWGVTSSLVASWGMEGEVASSDCFIVDKGGVGKSQGRGTCEIQIVSKVVHR